MRPLFKDPGLQARFAREGYVELDLLTGSDCERLVSLYDELFPEADGSPVFFSALEPSAARRRMASTGIRELLQPRLDGILEDCRAILGNFFCKQPAGGVSEIHLHQDWSFVDESIYDSLTIWCPLENVGTESGTLSVVPGSHWLNSHVRGFVSSFPYPELELQLRDRYSREVQATRGHVVMFHQRLFHWSAPNRSSARRLAANCFVAPGEAPIRFPHCDDARHPGQVELFVADEALLTSFAIGRRPEGAESLGLVPSQTEPLAKHDLERLLDSFLTEGAS